MKNDVKSICNRLLKNIDYCDIVSAIIYTMRGKTIDYEDIKECIKLMRKEFPADDKDDSRTILPRMYSLTGAGRIMVAAKMSLVDEKERYLEDIIKVSRKVREGRLNETFLENLASILICDAGKASEADSILEDAEKLWGRMRKNHPESIEDEDLCSAILLVLTGKSNYDILVDLEDMYSQLEISLAGHESLAYSLCHVLETYNEKPESKCERMIKLVETLREQHVIYGKKSEYAIVGLLADISVDVNEIVSDVSWVCEFLSEQAGFGSHYMGAQTRSVYAFLIVYLSYYRDGFTMSRQDEYTATPKAVVHRTMLYTIMRLLLKYEKEDYEARPCYDD